MSVLGIFFTIHETILYGIPLESPILIDDIMYSLIEKLRKTVTNLHQIFFIIWNHNIS